MNLNKYVLIMLVLFLVVSQSGCSLLQLPLTVVDGTFSLLGKLIGLANKLPKPPPWIFL